MASNGEVCMLPACECCCFSDKLISRKRASVSPNRFESPRQALERHSWRNCAPPRGRFENIRQLNHKLRRNTLILLLI